MAERRILVNNYHAPSRCEECGHDLTFTGVGSYRCDRCKHVQYDDYGLVRNYVEAHPGAPAAEVSEATGVDQAQIHTMLRDEKLEIASDSKVFLNCEGCGAQIRFGKYCAECSKLASAAAARRQKDKAKSNKEISGVAIGNTEVAQGAKRFERR